MLGYAQCGSFSSPQPQNTQFFTPVGTPHDSDHWGGVGSVTGRVSPLPCQFDDCASVCSWVGPSEGPRLGRGSVVSFMTRGNINEMPAMSASDGWSEGWHLRNQGYKKTGEKIPSLEALYTCVSVDLVRSANPLTNVAKSVKLPQVDFDTHGLPPCFVFNLQFPFCEAPSVWGNSGGPTVNAVVTFTLKEMTAEELDKIPAAKLVKELFAAVSENGSNGTDSALLGRFKVRLHRGVTRHTRTRTHTHTHTHTALTDACPCREGSAEDVLSVQRKACSCDAVRKAVQK